MSQSLAVEMRPSCFANVLGQASIIRIMQKQLETGNISHCYLFAGGSGCGKTTTARIFGYEINKGKGSIEEIDAASHNSVDDVRDIVNRAKERSIDSEYKIFILDECHTFSAQAWQAFLKTIEEPPEYTIFIFCTTNPEKIPATILNRVMRFNFSRVDSALICERLKKICEIKGYTNYDEACDYLARLGNGGVRDSIAYLEKCANYDTDLSIDNVLACLGNFSYNSFFDLTCSLVSQCEEDVITMLEEYYEAGNDLKMFIDSYIEFALDLVKYCLFNSLNHTKIPSSLESRCSGYLNNVPNATDYANKLVGKLLEVKNNIRYDVNPKTTVEVMLINICRGI